MKSVKYFTDKQRAILAGDPRPNPVSTSADPRVDLVGDRGLVDSEEDVVEAQEVRQYLTRITSSLSNLGSAS